MNDIEVSSIDLVEGGNVFKQGHYLTLGYVPRDENGETVDLSGKTLNVALWGRKGIVFEAPATFSGGVIRFTLDKTVPAAEDYTVEFTATSSTDAKYRKKFPANSNAARIAIKQSADDLGVIGISVYTVAQFQQLFDEAVGAVTEDSEVILARDGESLLGTRLDKDKQELTLQLADKASKAEVEAVASGSPREAFPGLTQLNAKYPNGAEGIYLTTDNGHWYFWYSGAWTDGGVYQSMALAEEVKRRIQSIEVLPVDPTDLWEGRIWMLGNQTPLFTETFTGTDGTAWDDAKWGATFILSPTTAVGSGAFLKAGQGIMTIGSTDGVGYGLIRKTTKNKVIDFTNYAKVIEFEISERMATASGFDGMSLNILPALVTGEFASSEPDSIRILVTYTSTRVVRIITKTGGTVRNTTDFSVTLTNQSLVKWRIVVNSANSFSVDRFNGTEWQTIFNSNGISLSFTTAYITLERHTKSTTLNSTQYIDNIKVV